MYFYMCKVEKEYTQNKNSSNLNLEILVRIHIY